MRSFLLMQLVFNILILVGLITIAVGGRRKPRRKEGGQKERRGCSSKEPPVTAKPPGESAPAPSFPQAGRLTEKLMSASGDGGDTAGLEELIERADRRELVAEKSLKQRLERLSARAAG